MKIFAIVLVVGIAGYAIYELFTGNKGLSSLFTTPGQITPSGASVPGVPVYSNVAAPSNAAGTVLGLATATVEQSDAFGPSGNLVDSDELDDTDVTSLVGNSTGSTDLADFASGSGGDDYGD
jgi:hypothetical protein